MKDFMSESEFEFHMQQVFKPDFYAADNFIFSEEALAFGLDYLADKSVELEMHLDEETNYFQGKFALMDELRRMQAVASMLAIACEVHSVRIP